MQKRPPKPRHDAAWNEEFEEWVMPWQCGCCKKCWMRLSGDRRGSCLHGGPYMGYVFVDDK